jgi:hypothetical protein
MSYIGLVASESTTGQQRRLGFTPILSLGFGRNRSRDAARGQRDRHDRNVAIAIARPAPAREQKQSRRVQAAHARIWGDSTSTAAPAVVGVSVGKAGARSV